MCFITILYTVQPLSSPVLLATDILAMGSAMIPYWIIIFLRLALRQLRDHVQHPLPPSLPASLPPYTKSSVRSAPQNASVGECRDCGEELECKYTVNSSVVASVYVRQYRKLCTYLTRVSGSVRPTREANRGTPLPVSSVHSLSPNLPVWPLTPSQRGSHKPSPSLTSPSTFGCGSSSISLVTVYYFPRWDSLRLHRELVYPLLTILPAPLNVSRNTHRT